MAHQYGSLCKFQRSTHETERQKWKKLSLSWARALLRKLGVKETYRSDGDTTVNVWRSIKWIKNNTVPIDIEKRLDYVVDQYQYKSYILITKSTMNLLSTLGWLHKRSFLIFFRDENRLPQVVFRDKWNMPKSSLFHKNVKFTYSSATANQSFDKDIIREHIKFLLLFTL